METVTVVGEVVVDRVVSGQAFIDVPGGSSANVALALTRCGFHVDFRARFGSDYQGQSLKNHATASGVDVTNSIDADEPATVVEVVVDNDGIPAYKFALDGTADWQWTEQELARPLPPGTVAIVAGSLASIADPGFLPMFKWAQNHKGHGVPVFYDPNVRPSAIEEMELSQIARERIVEWVKTAEVVKASDEDLAWFDPARSPQEIAAHFSTLGPRLVVLTAGSQGAFAYRNGKQVGQVGAPAVSVIDTVGAGDTLMAWLVSGYTELNPQERLEEAKILNILSQAVSAAAYTCTRRGCDPIYREQLADFIASPQKLRA